MSRANRLTVSALLASLAAVPTAARADATAQALFDEGKSLMEQQKFEQACPKLAESQRRDPGGGTVLHLAICYEQGGKTASAWVAFNEAVSVARRDRRDDRLKIAEERLSALTPKLTRLKLTVPPELAGLAGLTVSRNGEATSSAEWGTAVPVDPGRVRIDVTASGKRPFSTTLDATGAGATVEFVVPALRDGAVEPATATPVAQPATGGETPGAPETDRGGGFGAQRVLGLVLGGAGVIGLGVGTFFGLRSMSKKADANEYCDGSECSDERGVALRDEALSAGNVSTIGFVAGGVLVAGGVVLYLTAPDSPKRAGLAPAVAPGFAGLELSGRW